MTDYWIKGTHPHPSLDWANNQASPSVAYPFVEQTTTTPGSPTKKAQKTTHRAKPSEWEYMHLVNEWMGCGDSMPYVRKSGSGVINSASNPEEYPFRTTVPRYPTIYPKLEGVASGHNFVRGTGQKKNGAVEILMFDTDKPFPNVEEVNPTTHPWLFDEFHSINKKGEVGYAPEGKRFYYPRACKGGKAWMPVDILEERSIPDNLYKREVTVENDFFDGTFSTMLDMSHAWSGVHKDDGIDDGDEFDEDIVVFKVIHGLHHYTDPTSPYYEQAKKQRDSVDDTKIKGGYGWIVPELNGAEQVRDLANIVYGLGFSIAAVDLEERVNDKIIGEVIAGMKKYSVIYPRLHFWLYLNWSTYTMVKAYCQNHNLMDWFNGLHYNVNTGRGYLWVAGGPVYQQKIDFADLDGLDPFPMAIAMQLSTDKNELSDEVDYELDRLSESQNERLSIDVNKVRISPNKLWKYFDKGEAWEKRRTERPVEVQPKMTLKEFVAFIKAIARGITK